MMSKSLSGCQKYVLTSKMFVMTSEIRHKFVMTPKIRHDLKIHQNYIKKFVMASKIRHDLKIHKNYINKFVMTSKSLSIIRQDIKKFIILKIRQDVKNVIITSQCAMTSKSCHDIKECVMTSKS